MLWGGERLEHACARGHVAPLEGVHVLVRERGGEEGVFALCESCAQSSQAIRVSGSSDRACAASMADSMADSMAGSMAGVVQGIPCCAPKVDSLPC